MPNSNGRKTLDIECPACGSPATYRYGKTRAGKPRLRCVLCGRQFIVGAKRVEVKNRPVCRFCGKPMHLYKQEGQFLRFRCSDYPRCRTFMKMVRGKESSHAVDRMQITA